MIEIHTDGSSLGNPGPGGMGIVILYQGEEIRIGIPGGRQVTNNQMELRASIEALKYCSGIAGDIPLRMYTDSTYVVNGITKWIYAWIRKDYKDVKNAELWRELNELNTSMLVEWVWERGHSNNYYNNVADEYAKNSARQQRFINDTGEV